jgi:myosin heavy subunit
LLVRALLAVVLLALLGSAIMIRCYVNQPNAATPMQLTFKMQLSDIVALTLPRPRPWLSTFAYITHTNKHTCACSLNTCIQETLHSFETIGMDSDRQFQVFQVVAAVLHLSNIRFSPAQVQGAEGSQGDQRAIQTAAGILGVEPQQLNYVLTYRTLTTMAAGGAVETYQVPQNPTQATAARDALAKDLYFRLFDYLVQRVNNALESCGKSTRLSMRKAARQLTDDSQLSCGVLDIYGFEIFESNG